MRRQARNVHAGDFIALESGRVALIEARRTVTYPSGKDAIRLSFREVGGADEGALIMMPRELIEVVHPWPTAPREAYFKP